MLLNSEDEYLNTCSRSDLFGYPPGASNAYIRVTTSNTCEICSKMATTKNFALYCMMLCVLTTNNTNITLARLPQLCPSRTTCKHTLRVTCVYSQGRLVHLQCVQRVTTCEYALRATCRQPSTLFCRSSPRQCFCSCVNTRAVQHSRIRQGYY
ncbi:hypothetical protein MTO96_030890 [Rhipicephalus appendiculatus]